MPKNITGTDGYEGGSYQIPTNKDSGTDVFDVLETFMERMATHTHAGVHSANIFNSVSKTQLTAENIGTGSNPDWTEYTKTVEPGASTVAGTISDLKYIAFTIPSVVHQEGSDSYRPVKHFYYKVTEGDPGVAVWREFHPDIEYTDANEFRLITNMHDDIADVLVRIF